MTSRINLPETSLERQIRTSPGRHFRTSPGRQIGTFPGQSNRVFRGRPGDVGRGRPRDVLGTNICRLGIKYRFQDFFTVDKVPFESFYVEDTYVFQCEVKQKNVERRSSSLL